MADEFTPETARFIRFNRIESTTYAFAGERPVFLSEDNGARLVYDEDPEVQETASRALERFVQQQMNSIASVNRIEITTWNGSPVLETDGVATLEAIGFRREFPRMTYDALQARLSNSPSAT